METQIERIAALAYIDEQLDDLMEEFGDLPEKVRQREEKVKETTAIYEETENILNDIKKFVASAKKALVELKDKEEKLTKQQFQVRNNKEFDAITSEIAHIQNEHAKLVDKMRTEGLKEENIKRILEDQKVEREAAKYSLEDTKKEVDKLASEQNEQLEYLKKKREKLLKAIEKKNILEYERIRKHHPDAAVRIIRNSCNGTVIPSQVIVEVRNNKNKIFLDEHSGRILIPEEVEINDETIEKI